MPRTHFHRTEKTFSAITPLSAFDANKFHLVLYNNSDELVKVRRIIIIPDATAVTGAMSGVWSLQKRIAPTTAPVGGLITPTPHDELDTITHITLHNAPTTPPAGGIVKVINRFFPQPDEIKLSTLDASSMMGLTEGAGLCIYDARLGGEGVKPIILRKNETLEIQQDATGGTGNCRIYVLFTVI